MNIKPILMSLPLPDTYAREGKVCYFDPYRKKLIERTPEETVRQRVAKYCETVLQVPAEVIRLEEPISHYADGVPGRADIVIHRIVKGNSDSDEYLEPLAVIECKNERMSLTDQVFDQAIRYCDSIGAQYAVITNGVSIVMAAYQEKDDSYFVLDQIIDYPSMLGGDYQLPPPKPPTKRFDLFGSRPRGRGANRLDGHVRHRSGFQG